MAERIQDVREETVANPQELRLRLNQVIKRVNEASPRWKALRLPSVRAGQEVALPSPGFTPAAVVLAGVNRTDGADTITAAPWLSWRLTPDGRVSVTVQGLAALPAQYAVNLVLFEGESTT
jgi:hypothetical protein